MRVLLLLLALLAASPAAAAPKVMASILPIHAIVAAVMDGIGQPELIFRGQLSEHAAGLTPAQLVELGSADLVFMTSPGLEVKLGELSGSEAVEGNSFIFLAEAPGVSRLGLRSGGAWEKDADEEAPVAPGEGITTYNGHVWLDPENAKAMAAVVATALAAADPADQAAYAANARAFAEDVTKLEGEIAATLAPVRDKPFIVFHDAYPYFEKRFGLTAVGSIADASAAPPSARRIGELRAKLATSGAVCAFREPQFDSRFSDTVTEGTDVRTGILDAVGADLAPGPGAYRQLLENLAANLKTCLGGAG